MEGEAMAHTAEAHADAHAHAPQAFIWKYVFSKDHKVIGIQYYITAMLMALIAGLLAMLIRVQLAWPEVNWGLIGKILPMGFQGGQGQPYVMNPEFYAMLFTMHGTIMVFFVLFTASFTMGGLNFVTTIINLRTKGLSMLRMPLTMWSMFLVAVLGLLAFPALTGASLMLLLDRHFGTSFFLPTGLVLNNAPMVNANGQWVHQGGSPLLWQHLFWFLGHPEVYILMLPALGFTSDILATFCRKPIFGYKAMVGAMVAIGGLSFIVWGHHMFVRGMSPYLAMAFAVGTILIAVPSAVKVFNWLATLRGARIRFNTPMLWAMGVVSLFISGGLSGVWLAQSAPDIQLHDTMFVAAHFHLIMAGAALFGVFGATSDWLPKMFGRMMHDNLGKAHFWFTFIA